MRWRSPPQAVMASAVSISSATIGAAASPGHSPIAFRSGWGRSPRSRHHTAFLEPDAADLLLADNAKQLRERLAAAGVPSAAVEAHLGVLGNKGGVEAPLAWYLARGAIRSPLGPIRVPTLYIWGDADDTVGRSAAEGTEDFIAAPYRFEALPGVGHFAADQAPARVSELLLEHVRAYPT